MYESQIPRHVLMREADIPLGWDYSEIQFTNLDFLLLVPAYRKKKYAPKMINKTNATTSVGVKVARSCKSL